MPAYKNAVCRGSIMLGSACGRCERCDDERRRMTTALDNMPKVQSMRLAADVAGRDAQGNLVVLSAGTVFKFSIPFDIN